MFPQGQQKDKSDHKFFSIRQKHSNKLKKKKPFYFLNFFKPEAFHRQEGPTGAVC
jgi:hypothetical protein